MKTSRSRRVADAGLGISGQALAEFALVLPLMAGVLFLCARAWKAEWDRADCAWRAFSLAHARLVSDEGEGSRVEVELRCGELQERVALWKLEHVPW